MSKLGDVIGVLFYVPMLGNFLGVLCREYPVSAKLGTVKPWFMVDDVGSLAGVYCFTNELFLLYSPVTWDSHCQFLTFFPFDCVRSLLNLYEVCSTLVERFPDVFVFFNRNWSPGNTVLDTAPCLLSAYALVIRLWFQSRSRTFSYRMLLLFRRFGKFVFSSLPNTRNVGVILACGVVLYANMNFMSSPFHPFSLT